jgi:serralysin
VARASDNNGTYENRFINALMGESRWRSGDTVRYFFDGGGVGAGSGTYPANWTAENMGAAFETAAKAWSAVANITLVRTLDRTGADIVETTYSDPQDDVVASHNYPANFDVFGKFNVGRTDFFADGGTRLGGKGFSVFLHELGHALGLKHSFEAPAFPGVTVDDPDDKGDHELNSTEFTVMGYDFQRGYAGPGSLPTTPMAFDIAALQALYGPNR